MDKSPEAFRTISEVADHLETPAHVLRFWESRFPQIRPVKRAGGRRYYRPADVALLTGIKYLLHAEGMTIRGVQKVLRDQGVRHVAGLIGGADLVDFEIDAEVALEQALAANFASKDMVADTPPERAESATIIALESALRRTDAAALHPEIQVRNVVETVDFTKGFGEHRFDRPVSDRPVSDRPENETLPLPGFDLPLMPAPKAPLAPLPDLILDGPETDDPIPDTPIPDTPISGGPPNPFTPATTAAEAALRLAALPAGILVHKRRPVRGLRNRAQSLRDLLVTNSDLPAL